ncbi:2-oxoacid:ferredoxin oxidoreductase subunit beta [candidate division TA06 bacterium DG_24]|jgi:2-oxoglutarate ferredoxin oxidoreductase subunit beta|uniref:2-oxoacid:ferredoxin oxidoreductase subunit beta n=3 Tax=Bacteria division TA06 TaxID=1156500 RepID=A0A0S8JL46_UNCT6|nr:MAG: 2-oxoacid:ferredoxin oxidoreductase subunit beta [candidate division TA06 bacterium DG_24]KPK67714.1 MAG: 2-oxoacid:ferredoxin oxidoreductase subunit beta [candidate division TA06 bacterium SM23_40]KPL10376.1 MAG: 2-oxoacid:ferredoxin oxidoreductase subunit beta [candidate division TA06 bacterium SM1_40]
MSNGKPSEEHHPMEALLRMDRIPHIWCSTCGLGTSVSAFALALEDLQYDLDKICIVSGIGCTGRVAGYVKLDSFHATHGRAIPFATGLKLANPQLKVVVFSGDGDLIAIGGNHFIHAARRNMDLTVICVNNFIYAMTGGQVAPTSPLGASCSTTPYGNYERPFNIPHLAESCGAVYVARWTALHLRRTAKSIAEAMRKPGFSVVEIICPCSTLYARRNRLGDGLELMKFYHENSIIKHGADPRDVDIDFQSPIVVGKFVDRDRPTFIDGYNRAMTAKLGEKFEPYGVAPAEVHDG